MCVLCGDISGDVHWTERRPQGVVGDEGSRRQARFRRTRMLNRLLASHRVRVHEDLSGTQYIVCDPKGKQELARDLDELWTAADRLAGAAVDPLDRVLLERLETEPLA
jgi:hypothetical protein